MNRRQPAFTLPETLIALVLFVLAGGVLAEAINNALLALESMELKEGHEGDYRFVRSQIFTITDLTTFEAGGQVNTPTGGQATWTGNVTPTQTADLYAVNLTINLSPPDDSNPESEVRTYYLLRPSWTQDADDRNALLSTFHDNEAKIRTAQAWP